MSAKIKDQLPVIEPGPTMVRTFEDTLSGNRAAAVIDADAIPAVPGFFQPTTAKERKRRLKTVAASLKAEAKQAMSQIAARGPAVAGDFGPKAPLATEVAALLARFNNIDASLVKSDSLTAYLNELEDIALSDIFQVLKRYQKLYLANDDTGLATAYDKLLAFFQAKTDIIKAGRDRAKKAKAEKAAAKQAPTDQAQKDKKAA